MEEGYHELLALGREQTATLVQVCQAIAALSTITMAQQEQVTALRVRVAQAEERIDAMWEMILALEHTQENPIVVDDEETAVSEGEELCQGITPSNFKGGLPAPEAGACVQEGGVRAKINLTPSRSGGSQDKAEPR